MKKFKGDLKTVAEILVVILIYFGMASYETPFVSYLAIGLCYILWTYGLLEKYQYRKGKSNYILIPTQRDDYSKLTSCVLGGMIILGSILYSLFLLHAFTYFMGMAVLAGILILLNGIFDLPKGRIAIKKSKFEIEGSSEKPDQKDIQEIEISNERLKFRLNSDKNITIDYLNMDKNSAKELIRYIRSDLGNKHIDIQNQVR